MIVVGRGEYRIRFSDVLWVWATVKGITEWYRRVTGTKKSSPHADCRSQGLQVGMRMLWFLKEKWFFIYHFSLFIIQILKSCFLNTESYGLWSCSHPSEFLYCVLFLHESSYFIQLEVISFCTTIPTNPSMSVLFHSQSWKQRGYHPRNSHR